MAEQLGPLSFHADILFSNVTLIDGTGAPRVLADVAVKDDRISAIGNYANGGLPHVTAEKIIDAEGLVLAPGFIDTHTHDDGFLLLYPDMTPKVSQGVTTVVTGCCGISLAPLVIDKPPQPLDLLGPGDLFRYDTFADWLDHLAGHPTNVNVVPFVGYSTLRVRVMKDTERVADEQEIQAMSQELERALRTGAKGISLGTFYPPSVMASEQEILAVCEPIKRLGGIITSHLRDETDDIIPSMKELLRTGRALDCRVIFSHHKVGGTQNHGRSRETLTLLAQAAKQQPVGVDCHPYPATSTMLRLDRVRQSSCTMITWSKNCPDAEGCYFHTLMQEYGLNEEGLLEKLRPAGAIYFLMDEKDVERIACSPLTAFGSDGLPFDEHPHPRLWGMFTNVLARLVREKKLLTLEQAVHKMSSLAARQYDIVDRGTIVEGAFADLVLFDPDTVEDVATFTDPIQKSRGIVGVWVNGGQIWDSEQICASRPGKILYTDAKNELK